MDVFIKKLESRAINGIVHIKFAFLYFNVFSSNLISTLTCTRASKITKQNTVFSYFVDDFELII